MKLRALVVFPLAWSLVFAISASLAPLGARGVIVRVEVEGAKLLLLAGFMVAALTFEPGDYLRRGWALSALDVALLLTRDLTLVLHADRVACLPMGAWRAALVTVSNACGVAGTLLLARAWREAGLDSPVPLRARRAIVFGAVGIALVTTGPGIAHDTLAFAKGDWDAAVTLASDVGDAVSLVLIAPVLLTAMAMRGGLLLWPWGLFTMSLVCWLGYDAATLARHFTGADGVRLAAESMRALACTFGFSAGVAQRLVVTRPALAR